MSQTFSSPAWKGQRVSATRIVSGPFQTGNVRTRARLEAGQIVFQSPTLCYYVSWGRYQQMQLSDAAWPANAGVFGERRNEAQEKFDSQDI
jgi:hypothetical protein